MVIIWGNEIRKPHHYHAPRITISRERDSISFPRNSKSRERDKKKPPMSSPGLRINVPRVKSKIKLIRKAGVVIPRRCNRMELKPWTVTDIRWKRKLVSWISPEMKRKWSFFIIIIICIIALQVVSTCGLTLPMWDPTERTSIRVTVTSLDASAHAPRM